MSTVETAFVFQTLLLQMYFRKTLEINIFFYANKSDKKSTNMERVENLIKSFGVKWENAS